MQHTEKEGEGEREAAAAETGRELNTSVKGTRNAEMPKQIFWGEATAEEGDEAR